MNGNDSTGSLPEMQPAPSLVGEVLDNRYRIIRKLGEGGMGEVYAAEHIHIDKKFAIKLLRQEIVSNPEAVSRFQQEARSSSSIKHPNIIQIDDFGTLADGRIYMCMELLNGAALNDLITQPQTVERLLNILIQTGHGLAAAHAKNIVHRDMKPENIFVTIGAHNEDVPKILDFGIAKVAGNDGSNNLTKTGTIFGTPFYMAPEQALGNPVDARTDIYSMGVIMYEVFAGSLPFQGESFMGILTQHITTEPEPVAQRAAKAGKQLPNGLAEVITRCMQKNPAQRFATMDDLVNSMIQIYRGIAGAGMSSYMEAFTGGVPTSNRVPVPTPPPMTGPMSGQAPTVRGTDPTAQVPQTQSGGYPPGVPNDMVVPPNFVVASDSYNAVPPKKSKAGLIIAIIVVLLIGGAITTFAIVGGGSGSGSGSQVASGSEDGSDGSGSDTVGSNDSGSNDSGSNVAGSNDSGSNAAGSNDSGSGTNGSNDAGSNDVGSNAGSDIAGSGSDTKVETPDAGVLVLPPVHVKLYVKPRVGFQVYEDGKKLFDGPDLLEVTPDHPRTVTLKARGFKPKTITVDTKKKTVTTRLQREHHIVIGPGSNTPPPPPTVDCSAKFVIFKPSDPRFPACKRQYCSLHKTDVRCDLQ